MIPGIQAFTSYESSMLTNCLKLQNRIFLVFIYSWESTPPPAPQITSQFSIISSDHIFFLPCGYFCVFRCILLCHITHFFFKFRQRHVIV